MKKAIILQFLFVTTFFISLTSCSDSDDINVLVEYTNPMPNNPVNTLTWLNKIKQDAKASVDRMVNKEGYTRSCAFIKSYTYQSNTYYEVQYGATNLKLAMGPYDNNIYDSQGNLCAYLVGGDVRGYSPGYEYLRDIENTSILKILLWEYKTKE